MPASRFLKIVHETGQSPVCSFYLPVSTSRNHPVCILFGHRIHIILRQILQIYAIHRQVIHLLCPKLRCHAFVSYTRTRTHTHKHTWAHARAHAHVQEHTHVHTLTWAHARAHAHVRTHVHTYTRTRTYTHVYTRTHVHTCHTCV